MRKFLTSVADVYAYDSSENLLFTAKTLLDSSIEVSLGSTPIRGGQGNQLQYVYYHTGEMSFTLTEAQWNLAILAKTVGQSTDTGANIYVEENLQITRTVNVLSGSVVGTPLASGSTATLYGWADTDYTIENGLATYRGEFTGQALAMTCEADDTIETNDYICVRYYAADADATELVIPANIIPSSVKLVMETQLNSSDVSTNQIGTVQIIIPKASLSGAFSISMTADGVSSTPLSGMALATLPTADTTPCNDVPYYARIVENIDDANWYDDVIALAIQGGDFTIASGTTTLIVWAIPADATKQAFIVDNAEIDFVSATPGTVTVGAHTGVITYVGDGTSVVSATISSKTSIEATCTVTGAA